jgi:hypothetical protein
MTGTNVHKQPQPKTVIAPKSFTSSVTTMQTTAPSPDRIRERAYELYESRGCEPGQDKQDWLRAEQEILKRAR